LGGKIVLHIERLDKWWQMAHDLRGKIEENKKKIVVRRVK